MKLGLISDVHGDYVGLELAWAHLTVLKADRIVCAGDVVGYGPRPDAVVEFLKGHRVDSVRGNHDRWALERGPGAADPFGGPAPSRPTLDYLATLPPDLVVSEDSRIVAVVHGAPGDDMTYLTRSTHPPRVLRYLLARLGADVLVVGHTHRAM